MERTPRQLLGRTLLAIVVAATVLGILTLAAVASASTEGEFTFAEPHAGDRWSYSMELGEGWTFGANDTLREGVPHPGYDFVWRSPVLVRLPDGNLHAAAQLDVRGLVYDPPIFPGSAGDDGHHWREYLRSQWLGQDGLLAVELGSGGGAGAGSGGLSPGGISLLTSSHSVTSYSLVTDYDPERGLCLADTPVAGRTVSLDGRVHLLRPCHLGGLLRTEDGRWLRAGPVETVVGVQALRFDGEGLSLWFNPAIPYPVQVHVAASGGRGESTLRMTGFAAGTGPLLVPDDVADRDPLDPLDLQPPTQWGPDDAGSGFDFPLSEAFQRARDASEFPDLRNYLAAHADVFADGGHLSIETQQYSTATVNQTQGEARTWSLSLNSPTGCFWFSATREVARPEPVAGFGPSLIQVPGETMRTSYSFNTHSFGCIEENFLADKPSAPQTWPSVASSLAWWEAFASPEELRQGANGWAFQLWFRDGEWVQEMSIGQAAGRGLRTTTPMSVSYTGVGGDGGSLDLHDGRVVSYSRVVNEFRSDQSLGGLSAPRMAGGDEPGGTIVDTTPPLGQLSPIEITSIGVAAALAGLLVVVWPWLKGGAAFAGLFSRLQAPDLLNHPVRRELLQRIEAQPGVHYQDLVRALGKGKGAIEHHLRKLQAGGLVKAVPAGGYTCFFPVAYDRRLTAAAPALKSEGARKVLAAIRASPGASALQVAAATGLSPAAINHHLQRLGAAGLVDVLRNGRSLSLQPTALASQFALGEPAAA